MAICTKVREERDKAMALARELAKALEDRHGAPCGRDNCGTDKLLTRAREAGLLDKEGE